MSETTQAPVMFTPDPETTITVAKLRKLLEGIPACMDDIYMGADYPEHEGECASVGRIDVLENFSCVDLTAGTGGES